MLSERDKEKIKNERNKFVHLEQELKYENLKQELSNRRRKVYLQLVPAMTVMYTFLILFFFFFKNDFGLSFFRSNLQPDTNKLESQVIELKQNFNNLEKTIKNTSNTSDTKNLDIRMTQLEEGQNNIIASIDLDINKALTARLLQEKQKMLEDEISQLQSSQGDFNKRIDSLITTLVAVPLGGFVLSMISAGVIYFVNKSKKNKSEAIVS